MIDRLNDIESRYEFLKLELMNPDIFNDLKRITDISKEQSNLEEVVLKYREYKRILKDIDESKLMINDPELSEFAKEELIRLEERKLIVEQELEILLVPKDENDEKNVIMEIRGAAGGDEANIFAGDLFEMYSRYIDTTGWKIEVINEVRGSAGGYSQIEFIVKGKGAYSRLKYECGTHRVQRVPETETQGRVHTSTSTVIVMPEQEDIDIEIKETDIRVDIYRSSGAGGQSVNTSDSAVRMTHIPTGIVVTCQNERSQIKNRERAFKVLKSKVYEETIRRHEEEHDSERRTKIGNGDRSEKIRTYNYPQNRVTDHRINLTLMELDRIMLGKMDELIDALINEDQRRKLQGDAI